MVEVTLVTQDGCTPCRRVRKLLEGIRPEVPNLRVHEVTFTSEEGWRLVQQHGILLPPAVFVDGRLVGAGVIREIDLREALTPAPPVFA